MKYYLYLMLPILLILQRFLNIDDTGIIILAICVTGFVICDYLTDILKAIRR